MRLRRAASGDRVAELAVVLAFLLAWEVAARLGNSQFFPPPSEIFPRFVHLWFDGDPKTLFLSDAFREEVVPSFERAAMGWGLAIVIGVSVGLLIGRAPRLAPYVEPLLEFLRSIPPAALLPFSLLAFGLANGGKVFIITFGCVWPILINTIDGARGVPTGLVDTARVFQVGRRSRFLHVFLPAAQPHIFAGIRISLPIALIMMVLSELVGATNGIGFFILNAERQFAVVDMWAAIVLLGLTSYLIMLAFERIERHFMHWQVNFGEPR